MGKGPWRPSPSRAWWQDLLVLRPATPPPGPGYLVLCADEAGWLRATPLAPQGGAEEVPVILPRPQEALLLFLVKLGAGRGTGKHQNVSTLHSSTRREERATVDRPVSTLTGCVTTSKVLDLSEPLVFYPCIPETLAEYYVPGFVLCPGNAATNKLTAWAYAW